jgi:hypothetical protein
MAKNQLRPIVKTMPAPKLAKAEPGGRRGRPPRNGEHQAFTFRLPAALHRELRHFALDQGRPLNEILLEAIEGWWTTRSNAARRRGRA